MQACVMGLEMARKPGIEARAEFGAGSPVVLEIVHDVTDLIEQPFVLGLVLRELIVAALAHKLFFKGEVRGDAGKQIAEERAD